MTWLPTNANDVTLTVSELDFPDDGSAPTVDTELLNTSQITVDDFSIDTEEDGSSLSGIGRSTPRGISSGDIEHSFSFTVQGEDAQLFSSLADSEGRANPLQIIARSNDGSYQDKLTEAYPFERSFSGSSGDPVEYEVSGMAVKRDEREQSQN